MRKMKMEMMQLCPIFLNTMDPCEYLGLQVAEARWKYLCVLITWQQTKGRCDWKQYPFFHVEASFLIDPRVLF